MQNDQTILIHFFPVYRLVPIVGVQKQLSQPRLIVVGRGARLEKCTELLLPDAASLDPLERDIVHA